MKNAVDKINQNKSNPPKNTSKPNQKKRNWRDYDAAMKVMERMSRSSTSKVPSTSNGAKRPQALEVSQPSAAVRQRWAQNRAINKPKMQKLAELIKARRNITLAEKRKSRENTLALVRQYAQEARVKRAAAEAAATQPSQEKVNKMVICGLYY